MVWFKVDDKLHDHRKIAMAGVDAMGLWVVAGSWCSANLETEGFIPVRVMSRFTRGYRQRAERLVAAELWAKCDFKGEQGFRFLHWAEYQFTAADKEKDREAARERMRNLRAERKASSEDVRANISDVRISSDDVLVPSPLPIPSPEPSPEPKRSSNVLRVVVADRFEEFWQAYPRRDDKGKARAAWAKAVKIAEPELIIAAAGRYAIDPGRKPGYTKLPATWLNAEAWLNGPTEVGPPERAGQAGMSTGTQRAMAAVSAAQQIKDARSQQLQIGMA